MKTIFFFFRKRWRTKQKHSIPEFYSQIGHVLYSLLPAPLHLQPFTSSPGLLSTPVANSPRGSTPRSLQSLLTDESISSVLFLPTPTAHNFCYYGPQYLLR